MRNGLTRSLFLTFLLLAQEKSNKTCLQAGKMQHERCTSTRCWPPCYRTFPSVPLRSCTSTRSNYVKFGEYLLRTGNKVHLIGHWDRCSLTYFWSEKIRNVNQDEVMAELGLKNLRFSDQEVIHQIDGVLDRIKKELSTWKSFNSYKSLSCGGRRYLPVKYQTSYWIRAMRSSWFAWQKGRLH